MKTLTLIRHAKSEWGDPGLRDHDRPLNDRGQRDAPRIGRALSERSLAPQTIIASTALRAQMTSHLIAAELDYPEGNIISEARIYDAGIASLMEVIADIDDSLDRAILIGHNPGFHELANTLLPGDPIMNMPTCAVVHMTLKIDLWALAEPGSATLLDHLYPKMLR